MRLDNFTLFLSVLFLAESKGSSRSSGPAHDACVVFHLSGFQGDWATRLLCGFRTKCRCLGPLVEIYEIAHVEMSDRSWQHLKAIGPKMLNDDGDDDDDGEEKDLYHDNNHGKTC